MTTEPADAPRGRSGKLIVIIIIAVTLIAAVGLISLKIWPKHVAGQIERRVEGCIDDATDDAALERCARMAGDFADLARYPGWGAEAAKHEAQALASIAVLSYARAEKTATSPPAPELVVRSLSRALDLWPEVLDDSHAMKIWRLIGQPGGERIGPVASLRSRANLRRALMRAALRAGDFEKARAYAETAILGDPEPPAFDDEAQVGEALDEALLLCERKRSFADKLLAPILKEMTGAPRVARYQAACALAAGDRDGARQAFEQALPLAADPDETTLAHGELAALAVAAADKKGALAHATAALDGPAPQRPSGARGKLLALAALLNASPRDAATRLTGRAADWVYAPAASPDDVVTLDRAPPVNVELLRRGAAAAPDGPWAVALHLRTALELARLDQLDAARAEIAAARKLDGASLETRQLGGLIDAMNSDAGVFPSPEDRDRDHEVLAAVAGELDQVLAQGRELVAAKTNAVSDVAMLGDTLISRASIALRLDTRAQADQLLAEAWPLLRYVDLGLDGVEARTAYWHGGSGLRALRAAVIMLRADRAELDAFRADVARDKGLVGDEKQVVELALALADGKTAEVESALAANLVGHGPAFGSTGARRVLIARTMNHDSVQRALRRSDTVPVERRIWVLLRRVTGGSHAMAPPHDPALPAELLDLLRY